MEEIGVRELKTRTSEIMKTVREQGLSYSITYRGKAIATLTPIRDERLRLEQDLAVLAEMDKLAERIGRTWPKDVSALDAVREQRRDL